MSAHEPTWRRNGRDFMRIFGLLSAGIVTAAFGLLALLGWVLGLPRLASVGADLMPMAPSTAALFLTFGLAVGLRARTPLGRRAFGVSVAAGWLGVLVALPLFTLGCLDVHWAVEHLGLNITGTVGGAPIGHMSPVTAFCFLLASLSFLTSLLPSGTRSWRAVLALGAAGVLLGTSVIFLLTYSLFGTPLLYGGTFIPPALNTILAFTTLGLALATLAGRSVDLFGESAANGSGVASPFTLVFAVLAAGIVATGYIYYVSYERNYRSEAERRLSTIAEVRVGELAQYRKERLGDANILYHNPAFSELVRRFLEKPEDADARRRLQTWIGKCRGHYQNDRIFLLDAQGATRMSAPDLPTPVASVISAHVPEILRSDQVAFQDFYRHEQNQRVYLSVLVPLHDEADGNRPLGVVVMSIDPETYLFPLIQRWPTPSETAEILLVRREGNQVVFLNELRFRTSTALNLRAPLDRTTMPAVQAALGREGIMEGVDYRGVPVVAALRTISDSPWSLVARMDTAEVYAPLRERLRLTILLVGLLLAGAGAGFAWRQQTVSLYRQKSKAAEALRETNEYLENLFNYANAPIIVWDPRFRITRFNSASESLTGRGAAAVIGESLEILFSPAQVATSMAFIRKTLTGERRENVEIGILHVDGSVRTVLWNFATVFAPDGKTAVATIAQGHDITERKRAEEKIVCQLEELQRWQGVMLGREERNMKLKREVNELLGRLGEPIRYPSQESPEGTGNPEA